MDQDFRCLPSSARPEQRSLRPDQFLIFVLLEQKGHNGEDQEHDQEYFSDSGGGSGYTAKTEYAGDECDDQECDCQGQHDFSL